MLCVHPKMELCTSQAFCNLPSSANRHGFVASNTANLIFSRASIPLKRNLGPLGLQSCTRAEKTLGILLCTGSFSRETISEETISEETSTGFNEYDVEKRDGAVAVEDVSPVEENVASERVPEDAAKAESQENEQTLTLEFLDNIKLDSENTYPILLYGGGALVFLYLASAIIGAIDSIPLFPKLMEVVGLGYTLWFTTRYVLFKKNREELAAKIEEVKQQVLGSDNN